tara:strand:+ start:621 stop:2492 length:1872 start_codon:yes stop_codon:yes gene_type:complete
MSAQASALAAYLGALRLEPKLPFPEWATKHARTADGIPFKFRPYQVVPAHDMFNTEVASIALRQYSGAGKTYLFSLGYCYGIAQLRLKFGKMFPAEYLSTDWLREKVMPILRETPAMGSIPMVTDNALLKIWENGGEIKGVGSNSGGRIRTLEIDVADADEIDAIEQTAVDEGDKLAIFLRRTRGRRRQHHWLSSYPSIVGDSKIDAQIEKSDGCQWLYECPKCGKAQEFDTAHVVYPAGNPREAVAECPSCGGTFSDIERRESCEETGHWSNRDGERVTPGDLPSDKYGRRRGLHLNCMAHVGAHADKFANYLHEIAAGVEGWKAAERPEKARREFENTMRARSFEPSYAETASPADLEESLTEPPEMLPADVTAIYLGMDLNKEFIAVSVIAWGKSTLYPLAYEEIRGNWERPSTWQALGKIMKRKWKHPLGVDLGIRRACWDSGYQPDQVYLRARPFGRRVICVKGSSARAAPPIATVQKKVSERIRFMLVGPNELKAMLYDWLSPDVTTRTKVKFANYIDADGMPMFSDLYFAGLTCEDRTEEKHGGRMIPIFTHDKKVRNEPLDTFAYAIAAAKADRHDHAKQMLALELHAEETKGKSSPVRKDRGTFGKSVGGGSWL